MYPNLNIAPPLKHLRLHVQLPVEKSDQDALNLSQIEQHPEPVEKKGEKENKDHKENKTHKGRPKSTISADNEEEPPSLPENLATTSTTTNKERKTPGWTPASNNSIEATAKQIEFLLDTYGYLDYDQYMPLTNRILSCLINWELHSDKEIATACLAVKSLAESRVCGVLTDPVPVGQLIRLIDSQNVPLEIQMTVVSDINDYF